MPNGEENVMVILSSPSGAGKTTLTKKLQQKFQNFKTEKNCSKVFGRLSGKQKISLHVFRERDQ